MGVEKALKKVLYIAPTLWEDPISHNVPDEKDSKQYYICMSEEDFDSGCLKESLISILRDKGICNSEHIPIVGDSYTEPEPFQMFSFPTGNFIDYRKQIQITLESIRNNLYPDIVYVLSEPNETLDHAVICFLAEKIFHTIVFVGRKGEWKRNG